MSSICHIVSLKRICGNEEIGVDRFYESHWHVFYHCRSFFLRDMNIFMFLMCQFFVLSGYLCKPEIDHSYFLKKIFYAFLFPNVLF